MMTTINTNSGLKDRLMYPLFNEGGDKTVVLLTMEL